MLKTIINLIKHMTMLVGYVKSNTFKEKLSLEEENKYIEMLNTNNHELAREKLINHNLRLVAHIVKKYENFEHLSEDLISVGTIGLIKSIDTFSKDKVTKLSSYISRCIENEILMYIRSNKKNINTISIFDPLGVDDDGQEIKLEDLLSSEQIDYNEKIDTENKIDKLMKNLKVLDELELKILTLRYGLNNSKEYTQKEIGKMLNISRSYVSRIEKKALNKLLFEFRQNEL